MRKRPAPHLDSGVGTGFPSQQTRNAFARRSCSNKKMDDERDSTWLNHALGSKPEEQQHEPAHPRRIFTRLIDWSPFLIMGNTMPPRDPDEDEEDEDEDEEDRADEPPVVREPDED